MMKVGLALSGGAARGIAHIGVLKYLKEKEIRPSCIAGTSAGSIVGGLFCSGKTVGEIEEVAVNISWKDLVKTLIPRKGLIDSKKLHKILKEHLGKISFDELEVPLVVNAVDLLSGEEIVIEEGVVADAVLASCAIPGIFTPVKRDKYLLVDGGMLDNLPAALLKDKDLDHIVSVNVGAQNPLQDKPGTIFEILVQSFHIIRRQRDKAGYENTDTLIEPDLGDIAFHDISQVEELIKRGYEAAKDALADKSFD